MADIRPPSRFAPVQPPAAPRPADGARTAAQRAFFQAALGEMKGAAPAAVAAPTIAPARIEAPPPKVTPVADEAPVRYARPGSRLDIKV